MTSSKRRFVKHRPRNKSRGSRSFWYLQYVPYSIYVPERIYSRLGTLKRGLSAIKHRHDRMTFSAGWSDA